jgi:hypothetical protein
MAMTLGACAGTSTPATARADIAAGGGPIAQRYPGDVGIERDPDVVFTETFEEATLPELLDRWTDARNASAMSFSTDVPARSPGRHSLVIPWMGGHVSDGGHLFRQLDPAIDDTLHVRYYIKYPASGRYSHTGVWMGGYDPPLSFPNPQAGVKPTGQDRFSAAAEQNTQTGRFDHYNYWADMRPSPDGPHWGNLLLNAPAVQAGGGRWTCVEHMVKLNQPAGSLGGEHAIWLDGVKVSHLGPGFPRGSWTGGIFTQDPAGQPFEGFRWRTDENLRLNWVWLQTYAPDDAPGARGDLRFDHLVVAKSQVGCLAPAAGAAGTGAAGGEQRPWPNEPAGLLPLDDEAWSHLRRPAARGRIARVLERFTPGDQEPSSAWSYLRRGSSRDDDIARDDTAPLSPPQVLRIVFTPDMGRDREPSVHWIRLPHPREAFTGWWMKLSANWTPSPAGGGKITFLHTAPNGQGQVYSNVGGSSAPHRVNLNTEWAPYGQRFWEPNLETTPIQYDTWHRVEWYVKWESSPGAADGVLRWWVDGTLNGDYTDVRFPDHGVGFQQFEFAPTRQHPPAAEQYLYIDHTYVSAR